MVGGALACLGCCTILLPPLPPRVHPVKQLSPTHSLTPMPTTRYAARGRGGVLPGAPTPGVDAASVRRGSWGVGSRAPCCVLIGRARTDLETSRGSPQPSARSPLNWFSTPLLSCRGANKLVDVQTTEGPDLSDVTNNSRHDGPARCSGGRVWRWLSWYGRRAGFIFDGTAGEGEGPQPAKEGLLLFLVFGVVGSRPRGQLNPVWCALSPLPAGRHCYM